VADTTVAALNDLRERHLHVARKAADALEKAAWQVLHDIDAGRIPARPRVVGAAADLDRSMVALEAIGETAEIYGGETE
jgi:predicted secreted Zn-dependent protease